MSVETEYKNIAILYRSSFLTLPLEKKLTEHQIPYRLYGGVRFYQRKEIKDVLAYFRLVINPLDDVAFDRIVNVPKRGIGESSLDRLKYEAFLAKKSLYEYIANIGDYDTELKSKVINSLVLMVDKIDECRSKLEDDYEVYSTHLESLIEDIILMIESLLNGELDMTIGDLIYEGVSILDSSYLEIDERNIIVEFNETKLQLYKLSDDYILMVDGLKYDDYEIGGKIYLEEREYQFSINTSSFIDISEIFGDLGILLPNENENNQGEIQ